MDEDKALVIVVPRALRFFWSCGRPYKGSGHSQYQMSTNLIHPAGHAHFFEVSITMSEGTEDIGIMDASSVDHFKEAFKRLSLPFSITKQKNSQDSYDRE